MINMKIETFIFLSSFCIFLNITCNDGTISKTCSTCHQGCCSSHGGCTNNSYNSNKLIDANDNYTVKKKNTNKKLNNEGILLLTIVISAGIYRIYSNKKD